MTGTTLIGVEATRGELEQETPGVVDVFAALERQFFWADRVMLSVEDGQAVLTGEIVSAQS
ncbi:MAG: hypothetical protein ACTHNU_11415 [Gaiellales bacterium]